MRVLCTLVLLMGTAAAAGQAPSTTHPLAECRKRLASEGENLETARCFREAEARPGQIKGALREAIAGRGDRQTGWLKLALAGETGGPEARAIYQQALEVFESTGDSFGIFQACLGLAYESMHAGELHRAEDYLAQAERAHGDSWPDEDQARFLYYQTQLRYLQGEMNEAYALIRKADRLAADPRLRSSINNLIIRICRELDLRDEAYDAAQESLEIARDFYDQAPTVRRLSRLAAAYYDRASARTRAFLPSARQRRLYAEDLEKALELAQQSGNRDVEIRALRYLAETEDAAQGQQRLRRCVELSVGNFSYLRAGCLRTQAAFIAPQDPLKAQQLLRQTYQADDELSDLWNELKGWKEHCEVLWHLHPPEKAVAACLPVLDAIESLRANQAGSIRDRLLSQWSEPYYWISGRLLQTNHSRETIEQAFAVMERLRGQSLREALSPTSGGPSGRAPDDAMLRDLNDDLESCFRRLLDPSLTDRQQKELALKLEQTENAIQRRRQELGYRNASALPPIDSDLLRQVQSALREDEALLSYQIGRWKSFDGGFWGGSFVLVITRETVRVHSLAADRTVLEPAVRMFLSEAAVPSRDGLSELHQRLLKPAVDGLPSSVDKLILVLDGALHRIPFSLLGTTPESPRLIETYGISTVPSAALWLQIRKSGPLSADADAACPAQRALIVAGPTPPASAETGQENGWNDGDVRSRKVLGELPYAREEGRRIQRRLGGILWTGEEASEEALKDLDLEPYLILHFAAHALVRDLNPQRSAVLLTPTSSEDGWLRPEEISQLRGLQGKAVVLASCKGSAGEILRGEGVLSLARAFFGGGARSVIGSLQPLDDRQAMLFFDDFYRHLADGQSLGGALADTQRQWLKRRPQDPTWSSIVLLGGSAWIPFPGGLPGHSPWRPSPAAAAVAALLLAGALLLLFRLRSARS